MLDTSCFLLPCVTSQGESMPPYDVDMLYKSLLGAIPARGTIRQRMHAVIDACERQLPHPDWACLRRIDFDADLALLNAWLAAAWREGTLHAGHHGLWFGLVNPIRMADGPTSDMYVASAPAYDGAALDWPCDIDLRDGVSYLESAVLGDIYRIAYASHAGLQDKAEYPLALAYAAIAATTALEQEPLPPELASLRGAAAGFDDGDALILGVFDNLRFCPQVRAM